MATSSRACRASGRGGLAGHAARREALGEEIAGEPGETKQACTARHARGESEARVGKGKGRKHTRRGAGGGGGAALGDAYKWEGVGGYQSARANADGCAALRWTDPSAEEQGACSIDVAELVRASLAAKVRLTLVVGGDVVRVLRLSVVFAADRAGSSAVAILVGVVKRRRERVDIDGRPAVSRGCVRGSVLSRQRWPRKTLEDTRPRRIVRRVERRRDRRRRRLWRAGFSKLGDERPPVGRVEVVASVDRVRAPKGRDWVGDRTIGRQLSVRDGVSGAEIPLTLLSTDARDRLIRVVVLVARLRAV